MFSYFPLHDLDGTYVCACVRARACVCDARARVLNKFLLLKKESTARFYLITVSGPYVQSSLFMFYTFKVKVIRASLDIII